MLRMQDVEHHAVLLPESRTGQRAAQGVALFTFILDTAVWLNQLLQSKEKFSKRTRLRLSLKDCCVTPVRLLCSAEIPPSREFVL